MALPRLTVAQLCWIAAGAVLLSLGTLFRIVRPRRRLPVAGLDPAPASGELHRYCRLSARVAGLFSMSVGLLVLAGGWALNIACMRSVLPGYSEMRPNTALCLLLLGLALALSDEFDPGKFKPRVVRVCAGITVLIGLATLIEYVSGINLHVGEVLFRKTVLAVGEKPMALMTALNLTLLGFSFFFSRKRRSFEACQYLVVTAGCMGLINLVGYLYGIKSFYGLAFNSGSYFSTAMALHTAIVFVVLSMGILLSRPNWGLMATVTSEAPGGLMVRRLLPYAFAIPMILGWLRWQGQLRGFYDAAFGLTLFTTSNIVVFTFMIWRSGILLNRLNLERSTVESNLRRSEAGFRQLADSMPQIIFTATPDGNLDYYNQRWYDYTGLTFEQTKDWGWKGVIHPDDLPNTIEVWTRALADGQSFEIEYRFRRGSDGAYRWHLGRAAQLIDSEGKIVRWFGTCTDFDDYKNAAAENQRLKEQLEDRVRDRTAELERANTALKSFSHRLEQSNMELQDFASVASHDLQEPLRKVQVFGDRLQTAYGGALDAQGLDYLERMMNAGRRMQSLVQDLLTFSRVTSQGRPFVPVDLSQVTREVLSDLEVRIAETAARVTVDALPTIEADPVQMRQLLQNLIGNALKFHAKEQAPVVRVGAEATRDGSLKLIVEDQGIGFEEKYLDRIFTVFQRLHGRAGYEGTGIGLAICRKIAQRHGGEITAMSTPGKGATFIVTLPPRDAIGQSLEHQSRLGDLPQDRPAAA